MRQTLTVRLVPTKRTDLICVVCGHFRTEAAICPDGTVASDADAWAGIHKSCTAGAKRHRSAAEPAEPEPTEEAT